jgi:hypothetical protein
MLDSLKASFWPMGQGGNQEPNAEKKTEASDRLGELMGQLDAGIAKSMAREAAKPKPDGAQQRENDARPQAAAVQPEPQPEPQPRDVKVEPVLHVVKNESVMPQPEEPPSLEDDAADEAMSEALRLVAEQRKAAEALLFEACVLEDQLKDEVQVANAERASTVAKAESDRAAAEAEQAMLVALQKCDVRNALQAERKQLEELLAAKRAEAEAAKAKVEELERALQEAKDSAGQIHSAMTLHEVRANECADKESAAVTEETHAVERMQVCNASRDAAQAAAESARERVETLKQTLSARRTNGLEASQALAARIAEQVKLAKQHRESLGKYTAA